MLFQELACFSEQPNIMVSAKHCICDKTKHARFSKNAQKTVRFVAFSSLFTSLRFLNISILVREFSYFLNIQTLCLQQNTAHVIKQNLPEFSKNVKKTLRFVALSSLDTKFHDYYKRQYFSGVRILFQPARIWF